MRFTLFILIVPFYLYSHSYSTCDECTRFINKMHKKHHFSKSYLKNLLENTTHMQDVLNKYNGTVKGATDYSWHRYKSKILVKESVDLGKKFMKKYSNSLAEAKRRFGVEKEIITSFIRVESKFGIFGGEYSVWDALVTLSFNPNRKKRFFKSELESFLILSRREHLNPLEVKGSFAGAMGCVQQVPSVYLRYGVDLNQDGKKDPNSIPDCIGSIAKFLHKNRWRNNLQPVTKVSATNNNYLSLRSGYRSYYPLKTLRNYGVKTPSWWQYNKAYYIRLKDSNSYDLYLGNKNYRLITKYNASKQYATSIGLYYKALKE